MDFPPPPTPNSGELSGRGSDLVSGHVTNRATGRATGQGTGRATGRETGRETGRSSGLVNSARDSEPESGRKMKKGKDPALRSQVHVERDTDDLAFRYPLVYRHSWNYAAKLIQRSWCRYMMRVVYKYLYECCREFETMLSPKELSRIYPEFLESSDPQITAKLRIRMQGESFPPRLVCRIIADMAPSVDGGKHVPKWIPLYNAGGNSPINRKALVYLFLEANHNKDGSERLSVVRR